MQSAHVEKLVQGFGIRLRNDLRLQSNVIPIEHAFRLQRLRQVELEREAKEALASRIPSPKSVRGPAGKA